MPVLTQPNIYAPAYDPELWNSSSLDELESLAKSWRAAQAAQDPYSFLHLMRGLELAFQSNNGVPKEFIDFAHRMFGSIEELKERFNLAMAGPLKGPHFRTNCYAYAVNDIGPFPIYHSASPGDTQGRHIDWKSLTHSDQGKKYVRALIRGAESDGVQYIGGEPQYKDGYYLIAMLVKIEKNHRDDQMDVHFVRQDSDGGFSHKVNTVGVKRTDQDGGIISDPRVAYFLPYQFKGFFLVPQGGVSFPKFRIDLK